MIPKVMLNVLFTFWLVVIGVSGYAHPIDCDRFMQVPSDSIVVPDKMPEYPGGMTETMKYLSRSIKYPQKARDKGEQGRVVLQFVVERDGSITDVEVVKGVSSSIDKEAIRVIKKMPKWNPGILNGKPVRVRYTLPIMFRLGNGGKSRFDKVAEFPGGLRQCELFIRQNVEYPEQAQALQEFGSVYVDFVIDEQGYVVNAKIKKSVGFYADREALRVVRMMPRWTPAIKDGKPVRSERTVVVPFRRMDR